MLYGSWYWPTKLVPLKNGIASFCYFDNPFWSCSIFNLNRSTEFLCNALQSFRDSGTACKEARTNHSVRCLTLDNTGSVVQDDVHKEAVVHLLVSKTIVLRRRELTPEAYHQIVLAWIFNPLKRPELDKATSEASELSRLTEEAVSEVTHYLDSVDVLWCTLK